MAQASTLSGLLACTLVVLLAAPGSAQSQTPQLSPAAAKIRDKVNSLAVGGRITVNMIAGEQYCGSIGSIDAESLLVHEVDLKTDLTLRYQDIERVRKDYGRKGFNGRRVHPRTGLIAGLAIVGGLLLLVIVAIKADKS